MSVTAQAFGQEKHYHVSFIIHSHNR